MSIASYADLKSAITNWMARTDLAGDADTFIDLAEARLNAEVRTREQETTATITLTSGSGDLPADYLEWRTVRLNSSPKIVLHPMSAERLLANYAEESGIGGHFAIQGDKILVRPVPSNSVEMVYYAKHPALSDSTTTNDILTRYPTLYLMASLYEAATYVKDIQAAAGYETRYQYALQQARIDNVSSQFPKIITYASGPTP
jgi:hypothetical protein